MEIDIIKAILRDNKSILKGKALQVGDNTYTSLKDFGKALFL